MVAIAVEHFGSAELPAVELAEHSDETAPSAVELVALDVEYFGSTDESCETESPAVELVETSSAQVSSILASSVRASLILASFAWTAFRLTSSCENQSASLLTFADHLSVVSVTESH